MDLLAELEAGMSWRRFQVLLAGLSANSVYGYAVRQAGRPQPLKAKDAAGFFASFPKAGE